MKAEDNYRFMDMLIDKMNTLKLNHQKMYFMYSTPECFLSALNSMRRNWPHRSGDFFPYVSSKNAHKVFTLHM